MPDLTELVGSTTRSITRTGTRYAVQLKRSYPFDIQEVWSAWTTPARLGRWLGELSGDPRVGGVVQLTMSPPDQDVATLHITTCSPPTTVQARWSYADEPDSTVDLFLEPAGDSTSLTLTHSQVIATTAAEYGYGWEDFLSRLTELLANRDPAAVSWADAEQHLKPLWEDLLRNA